MSIQQITNDIYFSNKESIEKAIHDGLDGNKLDFLLWFQVTSTLMSHVEKYKKLSGKTKRNVVVAICILGIKDSNLDNKKKNIIIMVLENTLPPILDQAALMAHSVNIQGRFGKLFKTFTHCFCGSL